MLNLCFVLRWPCAVDGTSSPVMVILCFGCHVGRKTQRTTSERRWMPSQVLAWCVRLSCVMFSACWRRWRSNTTQVCSEIRIFVVDLHEKTSLLNDEWMPVAEKQQLVSALFLYCFKRPSLLGFHVLFRCFKICVIIIYFWVLCHLIVLAALSLFQDTGRFKRIKG